MDMDAMLKAICGSGSGLEYVSSENPVDSKNMKLVKFNLLCKELKNYFDGELSNQMPIPIYLIPNYFQEKNAYIKCVADICFWVCLPYTARNVYPKRQDDNSSYKLEELIKVIETIKNGSHSRLPSWMEHELWEDTTAYKIIFWNLLSVTIDDECYDSELSCVIDLAYCLGFTPEMIGDWCRAVEYVLSGNRLSETCDLRCDTSEGAIFFLHQEDKSNVVKQVRELLQ